MNILVTGCNGFVGRQFVKRLADEGHVVYGIDRSGINPAEGLSSFLCADIRDYFNNNLRFHNSFMGPSYQFDQVYHFAAIVGGRAVIEGNPLSVATDLAIDADLFQWALRTQQPELILFSSSAAYPIDLQTVNFAMFAPNKRLKESDIDLNNYRSADLTYGFSKLALEYQAQFAQQAGVKCHIFRPFSGYGETQSVDYPFPSIIDRVLRKENPLTVWSDTIRDFIHIDDIVDGVLAAVAADVEGPLNLGTGVSTSFSMLATLTAQLAGHEAQLEVLDDKPMGVYKRVCDPEKFFSVYKPKISLEEGIERALRYRNGLYN